MFTFRTKLTLLTLLPLLVLIAGVTFFAIHQSARLSGVQSDILKDGLLQAKKAELKNYMELAYTAISDIYEDPALSRNQAQGRVADAFRRMEYGSDGYFFVYDYDGVNIVHPRLEHLAGQDLWNFRDEDGNLLIQELIRKAQAGGGFTEYRWDKPSGGNSEPKLSYSIGLDDWGWMVGTGLYLDDVELVVSQMERHMVGNARKTILLMAFFTASCLLVIAVIGLAVNLSEARVANRKMVRMAQKTFSFLEKERRRISRELHDGINQLLVSARFKLERVDDALGRGDHLDASSSLAATDRILETGIQDLRRLAYDLRPSMLDDLGLVAALESLCSGLVERKPVQIQFESNIDSRQCQPVLATALYRITQESLHNIEKHAGRVHQVRVKVRRRRSWVYLEIEDDGEGFAWRPDQSQEQDGSGLGLRNIQDRVDLLGGRLTIDTAPGKGVRIRLKVPYQRATSKASGERSDGRVYKRTFGGRSSAGSGRPALPAGGPAGH
ncbi:histidine kinase [Halomonas campisalis]|uniref:Oxygen sensor histidine kinase NreB n=1 Tax=Billgrantia campisalis TaxID=74661 RepID=A0ABS9P8B0_9GAMM|nr:cache domain-containing protein [Halomonas campisalis]MCG6658015.1 histidine kinase [Halomonas campisalis]MDR5864849.1 cache domain-containing protein [Halomonas campisalis]